MYTTILYYLYTHIAEPEACKKEQVALCKSLNLLGRIILAEEGINGTLSGKTEDISVYMNTMETNSIFKGIDFKKAETENMPFPRLSIKVRKEIVSLQLDKDIDMTKPLAKKGTYIEPSKFHEILQNDEDCTIVDMRNDYETAIGKFKNSVTLDMSNFRDLPKVINKLESKKNARVITVCTGGVRCEKATAYLIEAGFTNVSQLHGGIIEYCNAFPDGTFEGKCYVFDNRIAIEVNDGEYKSVIATCRYCHMATDRYVNCANKECNLQFICCESCRNEHKGFCKEDCHIYYQQKLCSEEHMKSAA